MRGLAAYDLARCVVGSLSNPWHGRVFRVGLALRSGRALMLGARSRAPAPAFSSVGAHLPRTGCYRVDGSLLVS